MTTDLGPERPVAGGEDVCREQGVGGGVGDHGVGQLANAATKGRIVDERQLNFMLAIVTGIEPRDQLEAMLAAQMAAVHNAAMTFARQIGRVTPKKVSA